MSTQLTLIGAAAAAAMLGVHPTQVYYLVKTGKLKRARHRGYLFAPMDVIALVAARKTRRRARPTVGESVARALQEITG